MESVLIGGIVDLKDLGRFGALACLEKKKWGERERGSVSRKNLDPPLFCCKRKNAATQENTKSLVRVALTVFKSRLLSLWQHGIPSVSIVTYTAEEQAVDTLGEDCGDGGGSSQMRANFRSQTRDKKYGK